MSTVAASDHLRLIKQLRELTGSPISDVKACLTAANWDLAQAHEALRLKGVEAAAKKSTRHAAEGLVGLYSANPHLAVAVEVNSETDFVARNALFQALVQRVTQAAAALLPSKAHNSGSTQGEGAGCSAGPAVQELDVEQLLAQPLPGSGHTVAEEVAATVAVVRENIRVRRAYRLASSTGCLGTYLHQSAAPGLGRIAALVLLESSTPGPEPLASVPAVGELSSQLAMHVAGMRPSCIQHTAAQQAGGVGLPGPTAAADGAVQQDMEREGEGEPALLDQPFLLDPALSVRLVLQRQAERDGSPLHVAAFLRLQCGEGLQQL